MNNLDLQSQFRVLDRKMDLLFNFLFKNHDSKTNVNGTGEFAKINQVKALGLIYESDLADGDVPSPTNKANGETASFTQECSSSPDNSSLPENSETNRENPKRRNSHECQICKKSFKFHSKLKRHVLTHTKHEQKPTKFTSSKQLKGKSLVKCNICDKYLKQESMIKHRRIHTGEKPFSCIFCNQSFRQSSILKRHVITHTTKHEPKSTQPTNSKQLKETEKAKGQKSLAKCDICDKYLKHENMTRHRRIHSGEKPFSCIFCNQSFGTMTILKTHLLRHTGEKPFQCSICGKYCRQKGQFNVHMKRHSTSS